MWKLYTSVCILCVSLLSFSYYNNFFSDNPHIVNSMANQFANAIGVNVEIEPNQYNTLAAQLKEKEQELYEQEIAIAEAERRILEQYKEDRKQNRLIFLYVSFISGVLLLLILINFYMDWNKKGRAEE